MWISGNLVCSLSFRNIQLVQKPFVIKQQLPGQKGKQVEAYFKNIITLEVVCVWQLHLHLIRNYSIGPYNQESLPRTSKIEGSSSVFHTCFNSFIRQSHSEGKDKDESPIEENDVDGE